MVLNKAVTLRLPTEELLTQAQSHHQQLTPIHQYLLLRVTTVGT